MRIRRWLGIRSKATGIHPSRVRASTRSANSLRLRATLLLLVAAGLLMVAAIVAVGSATGGRGAPGAAERVGDVFDRGKRASRPVARGDSRELVSERTARSRTYRNANGSLVAQIFAAPIHYRDGRGRWRLIRNALRRDGAKITNSAGPYRLALPGDLRDAVQVREGQAALSFELADGEGGARVAGNRARYDGVLPGVDALYEAGSDSLKETLILERPDAPSVLRFELRPNANVRPQLKPDGAVDFVHRSGRVAFSFAPPFMVDSSGQSGGLSRDIAVSLRRQGSAYVLTLRPDRQWLQATERVYPVRLDPTINFSRTQACTISSRWPDSSRTGLYVGQDYGNRERALIQFDVASQIPRQAEILDARLGLFHDYRLNSSVTPVTGSSRGARLVRLAWLPRDVEAGRAWKPVDDIRWRLCTEHRRDENHRAGGPEPLCGMAPDRRREGLDGCPVPHLRLPTEGEPRDGDEQPQLRLQL
jgi:hypothetical protein